MCGILGAVAAGGDVGPALLAGLRRLEYRGYDSAGVAVVTAEGDLAVRRSPGRLEHLEATIRRNGLPGPSRIGIGHTRWATHGAPSERNAHPHADCRGDLVVIHNGIIENYLELRRALRGRGHRFQSETDSEALAHLVEEERASGKDLARAVGAALARVRGAFAIVVLDRRSPDRLVGARRDSPLVLGIGEGMHFLASDVPAFLDRTRTVVFLENGDVVEASADGYVVRDLGGGLLERAPVRVAWDQVAAERGGYDHFMLKEIHEQPDVLARTALGRLDEERGDVSFEEPWFGDDARLRSFDRVHLVACGTALHAALVGRFYLEAIAGLPCETDFASEYRYRRPFVSGSTLAIAVSQSGETADTIGAARHARGRGASVLSIVNAVGSTLTRESDAVLLTHAGPEIGVASTKAFTAQLVALYLLALRLGRARGRLGPEEARGRLHDLRALRARLDAVLASGSVEQVRAVARRFVEAKGFLFLGRGVQYPIALEGALKLKEISYVHAEGYPAGEMKHGPIALVEPDLPVVALATPSPLAEKVRANLEEVRARGGRVVAVLARGDEEAAAVADERIEVPEAPPDLAPIVNVVPLQLLAYEVARLRGCDIDRPRNLAKSVTVE